MKKEDMDGIIASYATCGICLDAFQPTYSPYSASITANSSSRLQFGLRLPCPQQHAYCVGCLTSYIEGKLDPEGKGGNSGIIVFPIRCPECPITDFIDGIPDDVAERVLGGEKMVLWVRSHNPTVFPFPLNAHPGSPKTPQLHPAHVLPESEMFGGGRNPRGHR